MPAQTHILTLPGAMLERGFWLYVWRVESPFGELLYVGRTGDNSSPHASAPYTRMGQHLGSVKTQNALRTHLKNRGVDPRACTLHLVSHGPLYREVEKAEDDDRKTLMERHLPLRNKVGAYERVLADELRKAGYDVLNKVKWRHSGDAEVWDAVRAAFQKHFPKLAALTT